VSRRRNSSRYVGSSSTCGPRSPCNRPAGGGAGLTQDGLVGQHRSGAPRGSPKIAPRAGLTPLWRQFARRDRSHDLRAAEAQSRKRKLNGVRREGVRPAAQFSQPLPILMTVVTLVLLIACPVANLLLAPQPPAAEIAMRLWLGASRASRPAAADRARCSRHWRCARPAPRDSGCPGPVSMVEPASRSRSAATGPDEMLLRSPSAYPR
jgi:hypothetical protein